MGKEQESWGPEALKVTLNCLDEILSLLLSLTF